MGWPGSVDTLSQVWSHIMTDTKEEAIRVAERNGM